MQFVDVEAIEDRILLDVFENRRVVDLDDVVVDLAGHMNMGVRVVRLLVDRQIVVFLAVDEDLRDDFVLEQKIDVVVDGAEIVETAFLEFVINFLDRQMTVFQDVDDGATLFRDANILLAQFSEYFFFVIHTITHPILTLL